MLNTAVYNDWECTNADSLVQVTLAGVTGAVTAWGAGGETGSQAGPQGVPANQLLPEE